MFTQFRRYSPNSKFRPSSCILAVLAMFLGSSSAIIFFSANRVKCSALLYRTANKTQPCPPGPLVAFHSSVIYAIDVIFHTANFKRLPALVNASWL